MDRASLPSAGVILTAAAGVLHAAAAVAHEDVSLVLSLAFLFAAAVQLGVVATARRWPAATAGLLTFTNLAAVAAWAVSRTVGLPLVGVGVEPIGIAGVATVALELAAVAAVVLGPRVAVASWKAGSLAMVVSLGTVAIAAPATGHAHNDRHGDTATGATHGATGGLRVVQLGPGDFEGDTDLTKTENAGAMKALMTGAVQPIIITSDGRLLGSAAHDAHDTGLADAVEARHRELAASSEDTDDGHAHAGGTTSHGQ